MIESLVHDERKGREAIESLVELSEVYSELWEQHLELLARVCTEAMSNDDFEDATRGTAMNLILTVVDI